MTTTAAALFRYYRPIIGWFAVIVVVADLIVTAAALLAGPLEPSLWLTLAGNAAKFWMLIAGIILVALNLRQFVANGVTRREFVAASAVFGLALAAGFAVLVTAGHALESAVLGVIGERAAGYPVFTAADILAEPGRTAPASLAYFVAGGLVAAGFYRFRAWLGVLLIIPGAVPLGLADRLLTLDGDAPTAYLPALLLTAAATVAVGALLHRVMRDIPIRRAAG